MDTNAGVTGGEDRLPYRQPRSHITGYLLQLFAKGSRPHRHIQYSESNPPSHPSTARARDGIIMTVWRA
jgi:hypothetical protein